MKRSTARLLAAAFLAAMPALGHGAGPDTAPRHEAREEMVAAWTHYRATVDLFRIANQNLAEAESLRNVAAGALAALRQEDAARPPAVPANGLQVAQAQLGLAEMLARAAQQEREMARAMFETARDNLVRLRQAPRGL